MPRGVPKPALDMPGLAVRVQIAEAVLDIVRESGLLRKKPGKRKKKDESEEETPKPKRKPKAKRPRPEPEPEVDDEGDDEEDD